MKDPGNPDNEGKVFLFKYGKKIHDKIMDAVNGDELEGRAGINPFDFWQGADFKLRVKKVAGYPNYDSSEFQSAGTLEELDDAQLESIWNRQYKLQPLVDPDQFKSYEQLQERMNLVLNLKNSASDNVSPVATTRDVPAVSVQQTVSFPKKEEPTPEPEVEKVTASDDETDDVLDYFRTTSGVLIKYH